MKKTKQKSNTLRIRRAWGGTLNLFLAGDLYAAVFLPLWLASTEEGITEGDAQQIISSCLILFLLTLLLRLMALGVGRLLDSRILGELDEHHLHWQGRTLALSDIREIGYRTFPCAVLFRTRPSGVLLRLDEETMLLEHAPYAIRYAIAARCPNARRRLSIGLWVLLGAAAFCSAAVTVWLAW
ncbi:MAG: hypothetical protein IJF49_06700 [Clostridia bacterium]|nr:hypothetical protein [Clostridia bacterium]